MLRLWHSNKEELTLERMREAVVVVIAQPRDKFSKQEVSIALVPNNKCMELHVSRVAHMDTQLFGRCCRVLSS